MTKQTLKYALLGSVLGVIFAVSAASAFVAVLLLLSVFIVYRVSGKCSRNFLVAIFLTGFAVRVILAAANYNVSMLAGLGSDTQPDARVYNSNALYIAGITGGVDYRDAIDKDPVLRDSIAVANTAYDGHLPKIPEYQNCYYVWLISAFYACFGYAPIAAKIINGLLGCWSAVLIFLIAIELLRSEKAARAAALVTMFMPSLVYWSSTLLKDGLFNFTLLLYSLLAIRFISRHRPLTFVYLVMSMTAACLLKHKIAYLLVITFSVIVIAGFREQFSRIARHQRWYIIISALLLAVMSVYFNMERIVTFIGTHFGSVIIVTKSLQSNPAMSYDLYYYVDIGPDSVFNPADVMANVILSWHFPLMVVRAVFFYFFSPLPWQVPYDHALYLAMYPQVLFTYILIPFAVIGFREAFRMNRAVTLALGIILAILIVPQAMTENVVGTAFRHKDTFMPFIIMFASHGYVQYFETGRMAGRLGLK